MADVVIDRRGLDELLNRATAALAERVAPEIEKDIRRNYEAVSEAMSTRLGRQVETWESPNHTMLRVGVRGRDAWLADIVELGSRSHFIVPKAARALRFMWRGRLVYRHRVHHPGTRAHHAIANAAIRKRRLR